MSPDQLRDSHRTARAATRGLRLPFRRHQWRGAAGNWMGVGIGSSIDFQDHRPYVPGDDPRYIDWQAYARSGQYTMKLYREEVSPRVDLLVDASASMHISDAKWRRTWDLVYFTIESASQASASIRCFAVEGNAWRWVPVDALRDDEADVLGAGGRGGDGAPDPRPVPLRTGALRVWISDLLYPTAPDRLLHSLRVRQGRVVVLAPFDPEEENPSWDGNVDLVDCETGRSRRQVVTAAVRRRYRQAYDRHFAEWRREARRFDANFARVPAAGSFRDALAADAVRAGAVETRH